MDEKIKFLNKKREIIKDRIITLDPTVWQMDLKTDMPNDDGYKNILVLVNLYNGYTDAEPVKNKSMVDVTEALSNMLKRRKTSGNRLLPTVICVDKGNEFFNKEMFEFLKKRDIKLVQENTPYHKNSMSIVERKISTITKPLLENMAAKSLINRKHNNKWVNNLKKVLTIINQDLEPRHSLSELIDEPPMVHKNLYPLGTVVYPLISHPIQLLNDKKTYPRFRHNTLRYDDKKPMKITDYRIRQGRPIRYILDNDYSISYNHDQILDPKNEY